MNKPPYVAFVVQSPRVRARQVRAARIANCLLCVGFIVGVVLPNPASMFVARHTHLTAVGATHARQY